MAIEAKTAGRRNRYIVLPAHGYSSSMLRSPKLKPTHHAVELMSRHGEADQESMHVLDSLGEDGPKLVEMSDDAELSLRVEIEGLKIVPLAYYVPARVEPATLRTHVTLADKPGVTLRVADSDTDLPIPDVTVRAFTNFRKRRGGEGISDANGQLTIALEPGLQIERLYALPLHSYWSRLNRSTTLGDNTVLRLRPLHLGGQSLLSHIYGHLPEDAGRDVLVGIIDTGVDTTHPDLPNVDALNLVLEEVQDDIGAESDGGPAKQDGGHGTHVAGIIGARGRAPNGVRGVAPGVRLLSYRVFPRDRPTSGNEGYGAEAFDIMRAIDRAVRDGCDIINLSLGGPAPDEAVRVAVGNAMDQGVLVIAAAGNDGRKPVRYPAAWPMTTAVSAMGRKSLLSRECAEQADVARPFGAPDSQNFIAGFSNMGSQVDLVGPGVAVVSTAPGGKYASMSGTSMAAPAVAGFAAYLLSENRDIMKMSGNERVRALESLLYKRAKSLGFTRYYEGFGIPT